jgi:carbonic anhydrase
VLLLSVGCNKLFAKDTPAPEAEEPKAEAAASSKAEHGDEKESGAAAGRFGVPFAWESSPNEPLAKARAFMADVLKANEGHVRQGKDHFKPFIDAESPRATVLTCADSRVQSAAWAQKPENDDYTVRNLGNQVSTSLGSLEYGVERLNTPVLFIIGHTGCDAVKAALDKDEKQKSALADEVGHIDVSGVRRSKDFDTTWTAAVIANVNAQVDKAVAQFGGLVQAGDLTVIGGVYDFRDDLEEGHGRLHIVNVNSNVEDARLEAFQKAVEEVNAKAAAAAIPKRTFPAPVPFAQQQQNQLNQHQQQPLSPGARASVSALNMLASGSFPGLRPGMPVPGTVDLKAAGTYPSTPSRATGDDAHGDHDEHEHDAKSAGSAHGASSPGSGHGSVPSGGHRAAAAHANTPPTGHETSSAHHGPTPRHTSPATGHEPRLAGHAGASAAAHGNTSASLAPGGAARPASAVQGRAGMGSVPARFAPPPAQARAPAPAPAPASRPLYPTSPYPSPGVPAAGVPGAPRQATPGVAPGRAPAASASPAPGAARARAPVAGQGRAPAAPAAPARGAPAKAAPPAAGQGKTPAPARRNTAAAKPGQGQGAKPTPPAAGQNKPPVVPRPRLPMPGPVAAGPDGPEAEDAPPSPNRRKTSAPPAGAAPPAKAAPPAGEAKPPAASPSNPAPRQPPPKAGAH